MLNPHESFQSRYYRNTLNSRNPFFDAFSRMNEKEWMEVLLRSIHESEIDGVSFPSFPDEQAQMRIHGNSNDLAIKEAMSFYSFVLSIKQVKDQIGSSKSFLDFGSGWGRISRTFLRDFDLAKMFAYEPNMSFCVLSRALNPYVCFLNGGYLPDRTLKSDEFDLIVGWSVFSHLSKNSATAWLQEMSRVMKHGGVCVFTTWGNRFLERLQKERIERDSGKELHWYSNVCIDAAGDIDSCIFRYNSGDFLWIKSNVSDIYGEAFISKTAITNILRDNNIALSLIEFDTSSLSQDVFVLQKNR